MLSITLQMLMFPFEAESIAYIVCNHFGLDTSEYSFTYIASWCESRDMKALKASMDTIRKTSSEVIENIEAQDARVGNGKTNPGYLP